MSYCPGCAESEAKLRASEEARKRAEVDRHGWAVKWADAEEAKRKAEREREALREALSELWAHWNSKEVKAAFMNDWIHGGRASQEVCDRAESVKRKVEAALSGAGAPQGGICEHGNTIPDPDCGCGT